MNLVFFESMLKRNPGNPKEKIDLRRPDILNFNS
jgi:hypothetical protein